MHISQVKFGKIAIDGSVYTKDIVIANGEVIKREKQASRKYKKDYGHTPLTVDENIPWDCKRLVIGSGMYGSLPVAREVRVKAKELDVELIIEPTPQACKHVNEKDTNFVFHLTC